MKRRSVAFVMAAAALAVCAAAAGAAELFVPVVAQVKGANGSYWNTEMWVTNLADAPGSFALTFLPAGRNNADRLLASGERTVLGPRETVHLKSVVPPGRSGALRIVTSDDIAVHCRVYNAQSRGSAGQMVPALSLDEMIAPGSRAVLVPLLRTGQFRTNLGLFNPGVNPVRVRVDVLDESGRRVGTASFGLDAGAQTQINDFLLQFKVSRADGFTAVITADGTFTAYATLVDRRSGAATFITPIVR